MESHRAVAHNPAPSRTGPAVPTIEGIALIRKQWHRMKLLPEGPQFIERVYAAQGLALPYVEKTQEEIERILQSKASVKPILKRRRLLSRVGNIQETPSMPSLESSLPILESSLHVLEPSLPVLEPSAPISSETVTIYSGITNSLSVTRLSESVPKLIAPMCMKATTVLVAAATPSSSHCVRATTVLPASAVPTPSSSHCVRATTVLPASAIPTPSSSHCVKTPTSLPGTSHSFASPLVTLTKVPSNIKSIFDPDTTNTTCPLQVFPIKNPIAKKSTTPRSKHIVPKDKIELLKSKYGIKECQVTLYDYFKDYGRTKRFGEWSSAKLSKKTELGNVDKKKEKKKLKDTKSKPLPKPNQKKRRDTSKNCDQPLAKKIRNSDSSETPVQTNTVPKIIILKNRLDDTVGISMSDDPPKDDSNNATSNKENIMADIGSCDGSEVNPNEAVWKRSVPPSNLAIPGKKGIDIKSVSCTTERIQTDEICKSDKALVIRIPQKNAPTECSTDTCLEKDQPGRNKTEPASSVPTKPQLLADTVPSQVASTETSKDDPTVSSEPSPSSTQSLTQVKDKPVISLEMYHARKNSVKSGQDSSNSSSPTHSETDPLSDPTRPSSKLNGHTSPGSTSDSEKSLSGLKRKQPSTSDNSSTPSPKRNGYASIAHTPEIHNLHRPVAAGNAPKKNRTTLNGASTPIAVELGQKCVSNKDSPQDDLKSPSLLDLPQPALKFIETHNNGVADLSRKLFLSTLAENNNTMCVGFQRVMSLPVDTIATAELDLVSLRLQPLRNVHRRTDNSQLRMVQWENCICNKCHKVFSLQNDWSSHHKTCDASNKQ